MKRSSFNVRSGSKGQSFVELSLVVFLLMLLVAGIAEFGVLLNRYLNLVDGTREAARWGANYDPFAACLPDSSGVVHGTVDADGICSDYYQSAAQEANSVISPITLNTAGYNGKYDDIVISVFVVTTSNFCRYPSYENGWSYREHHDGFTTNNHTSAQSSAYIQGGMDPSAPPVSVLLVEIYYNYPQTLRAPFFEQVFPDPIPVYTYAIMPLKNVTPPSC
jgi:hypothetical protein